MNDDQPTQPLTDAELSAIRTRFDNRNEDMRSWGPVTLFHAAREVPRLLAEVSRLRAEITIMGRGMHELDIENARFRAELEGWKDNAEDTLRMYDKLKAESVGTALGHRAKIERLQSQRDALVRKLGLDWGPDEFGDLSVVHVQSIEITNCPDEYCPGWRDSGICPNDYRHRF